MANHLAAETSPYLRQHAGNPVEWWPWCDAALAAARAQGKPILLSIGYSACHWCHVMAHESFEDAGTASVMNARYINIKVDREERPDIDKVYQLAHQALARRGGGWPLTMFLDPKTLLPFYAGTYFPKMPRHGLPGFVQVLEGVRQWFDDKPAEVRSQNASLAAFLGEHDRGDTHAEALDDAPIQSALAAIASSFDPENGGQRGGPKFPHASEIELLLALEPLSRRERGWGEGSGNLEKDIPPNPHPALRATFSRGETEKQMARLTLARMAERGLSDHLGGGFFRYCVDDHWEIPHFEKMLYDNAQLLPLYARATLTYALDATARGALTFAEPIFGNAVRACTDWLAREMQAPSGGFWSSLDADSEGEEGRYYVWQRDEVRALLTADEFAVAEPRFGLDREPNFDGHAWHLQLAASIDDIAANSGLTHGDVEHRLASAKAKLLAARAQRVRPALDDKILTAWNALLIAGVARAARWLDDQPLLAEAERALDFLHTNVWHDSRLYACHAGGSARFPAYLDDHAFLLDALLAMLQVNWSRRDLDWAIALADTLLERFEDRARGGFYFTAHDAEALPQRSKPFMDESLPCGNGIAARVLLRLGHLLGETRYLDAAERTLRAAWTTLTEYPHACCTLLLALDEYLDPRTHVVIRAATGDEARRWNAGIAARIDASANVYRIPAGAEGLPATLADQSHHPGGRAYVCRGTACLPPIDDPDRLRDALATRDPH